MSRESCFSTIAGPPDGWDGAPFTFVTEGVEAAGKQARDQAGDGVVGVAVTHLCYAVERESYLVPSGVSWRGATRGLSPEGGSLPA